MAKEYVWAIERLIRDSWEGEPTEESNVFELHRSKSKAEAARVQYNREFLFATYIEFPADDDCFKELQNLYYAKPCNLDKILAAVPKEAMELVSQRVADPKSLQNENHQELTYIILEAYQQCESAYEEFSIRRMELKP